MPSHALIAILAAAMAVAPDDVRREGDVKHRQSVAALELKAMPEEAIAALGSWTNGPAPDAEALASGPVLYVTWASWYETSHGGVALAQKLHDRFAAEGLLVIGVHHPNGYEGAGQFLQKRSITFPIARDDGGFRQGLQSDAPGGPDFYIVDRAGNLRFADVATNSVEKGVEVVMSETAEAAAKVPGERREEAEQVERDARKTRDSDGLKPGELLSVPFDLPPASAYAAAKWPAHGSRLSAADFQGKALPKPLGSETYLSGKPETKGRLIVIDFWATWCGPCKLAMPMLDDLQARHTQDLVIIGISDEPRNTVETFLRQNPHDYTQAVDQKRTIKNPMQVRGIPHAVVISTDGIIRWQGNPLDPNFTKAVEKCLEVDPGIKARQKAEQEHLKAQST